MKFPMGRGVVFLWKKHEEGMYRLVDKVLVDGNTSFIVTQVHDTNHTPLEMYTAKEFVDTFLYNDDHE